MTSLGIPARYAAFLGLVAVQRVAELALSRRNLSGAGADAKAAESAARFRTMVLVHGGLIVLPAAEAALRGARAPGGVFLGSLALFALAQALRYSAIAALGRCWNVRAVVDPALGFVAHGPYRWIRHPNYLAVLAEFVAIPAAGGAWISLLVLNALHLPVLFRRIRAEENSLARVPGYAEAMRGKGRFVPALRISRPS